MSGATGASRAVSRDVPVATRDVVEHGMSGATRSRLVEDVEALDALEVVFLVHVVLRHQLLELRARHVHTAPPGGHKTQDSRHKLLELRARHVRAAPSGGHKTVDICCRLFTHLT